MSKSTWWLEPFLPWRTTVLWAVFLLSLFKEPIMNPDPAHIWESWMVSSKYDITLIVPTNVTEHPGNGNITAPTRRFHHETIQDNS